MTKPSTIVVLAAASLLGSTWLASAQTPAGGAGAGVGADASRAERIEDSRMNREPAATIGSAPRTEREERGLAPTYPSNAPIPNAALSRPDAVEAAPAGR